MLLPGVTHWWRHGAALWPAFGLPTCEVSGALHTFRTLRAGRDSAGAEPRMGAASALTVVRCLTFDGCRTHEYGCKPAALLEAADVPGKTVGPQVASNSRLRWLFAAGFVCQQ
jgi:hypothetical protein